MELLFTWNSLNSIERYDEAIAIIDALARPVQQLGLRYLAQSRQQTAHFLRCIVDTRAGRYGDSMARARQLAASFAMTAGSLQAVQLDLLDEIYPSTTSDAANNPAAPAPIGYKEQFETLYLIADALLQTHTPTAQEKTACNHAARHMQIQPDEIDTTPGQAQEEPEFKTLLERSMQQAKRDYQAAHPHQRNEYRTDSTPEDDDDNPLQRQLRIFSRLHEMSPVSAREQHLRHILTNEVLLNNPEELCEYINEALNSESDEHSPLRDDDNTLTEDEKHTRRLQNLAKAARMAVPLLCEADFVVLGKRIHQLDELTLRHLMRIVAGHPADWLAPNQQLPLSLPYARLLLIDMVQFISREYSNRLSQIAELTNVLAYNRAETGLHLAHTYEDSAFATTLASYMMNLTPSGTSVREQFARKLAQFADTLGRVRYRDVTHYHSDWRDFEHHDVGETTPKPHSTLVDAPNLPHVTHTLKNAERYLRYSVRYDQQRAIVHYHLARVYLTRAELEWQSDPDIVDYLETRAPYIDAAITQAFRHWRQAKEFDRFDRLHIKLNWLYGQISEYKHAREKRQFRGWPGMKMLSLCHRFSVALPSNTLTLHHRSYF